jgi:hypothetical protein
MTIALRLTDASKSLTINAAPPFEATINYSNGDAFVFASSLENGNPTITPERETWLRDSNDDLLFDSDKQLLEAAE